MKNMQVIGASLNYTYPIFGATGTAHGGPHWDVQHLKGFHQNIYPGGKHDRGKSMSTELICSRVLFYAPGDEELFFIWIKNIKCITRFFGQHRDIILVFNPELMDDECLQELIALFYRYKINMKQLAQFLTESNKEWFFDNKIAFWHKKVFGSSKILKGEYNG